MEGITVLESGGDIVDRLAIVIDQFTKLDKDVRLDLEIAAHKNTEKHFVWPKMIERYMSAYELAIKKSLDSG
ncbi:MAG: glycosyltransferase family 4 protein [Candidatus Altiarchaeota archaeon]|nr:glycosyltransferase family 4 protein [Candidatus Altiarchaeota archaeon]